MRTFLSMTDEFLHSRGRFAVDAPFAGQVSRLFLLVAIFGTLYGAVMGSFSGLEAGRWHQLLYSGVKVPMLLLVTFALCLPSFFVLNSAAGLRADFGQALRGVVAGQACACVVLAALAPLTAFWYASYDDYRTALLFNGLMFAIASFTAQVVIRRYYRALIGRSRLHRTMLRMWLFFYIFVGIQMAWVLRPFIGDPQQPVTFFRAGAWGNAYMVVGTLLLDLVRRLGPG